MPSNNPFAVSPPPAVSMDPFGAQAEVTATSNEIWGSSSEQQDGEGAGSTMTREQPQAEWGETESSNPWGETAATGGETGQQATGGSASGHQPNSSSLPDVRSLRLDGSSPVGQQWTQDPQSQSPSSAPPLPRRPLSNQTSFAEPPNLPPRSIFTSQANMQRPSHSSNPRSPRNPFASSSSNPTSARVPFGGDGQPSPAQPFLSSISFTTPSASVGTSTRAIVRSAMEELVKAHHDEIFLRQLKAPAASSPPPHNSPPIPHHYPSEHDAATESFISAFPSLSRSPSPAASAPPAPQAVGSLSSSGGFEEQVQRTTDLLVWQLEQQVEAEVAKGEQGWRGEKARGMQEVEELERELMEESEGRKKAENELKTLQLALQEATMSHNLDLEAAARASAELSDRVDILQAALNEASEQQ